MNISEKTAIVTGASSGLGAALAAVLVARGAKVYGLARNLDKLKAIGKQLGEAFAPVDLDITDQSAVVSWIAATFNGPHFPDILVNNAGTGYFAKIDELTSGQWHAMVNTNLNGTFYITSGIVPLLKRNPSPTHIINIGSILGKTTRSEGAAYSATKYALQGFSESLFKELRGDNIKVTCINPGSIATHFFQESGIQPHENMLQPNDVAAFIAQVIETPDNFLIDEITLRPLDPKKPNSGNK